MTSVLRGQPISSLGGAAASAIHPSGWVRAFSDPHPTGITDMGAEGWGGGGSRHVDSARPWLFLPKGPVSLCLQVSSATGGWGLPQAGLSLHVFNRSLRQKEQEATHPTSLYFSG